MFLWIIYYIIIISHILITINRLIWLDNGYKSEHMITQDKNHIPWNKNHIPPPRKPRWFSPPDLSFFDRKTSEALGTHHLQETVTMLWMWFLNVWDNVPMDLKYVCQQYFTCMCFLDFIRYNKTLIAYGFRKYEHLFTLREYDTLGWIHFHIFLTSMQ